MNPSSRHLDEIDRRQFLSRTAKSLLGVGMLPLAGTSLFGAGGIDRGIAGRKNPARKVIYLYMSGGMSHLDTFDVKPDAPVEYRGDVKAIKTSADGVRISEYLPDLAKQMHKAVIFNSLSSKTGAHAQGAYLMRTNYEERGTIRHPHIGAWHLKYNDRINDQLPGFVAINSGSRAVGAGFFGSSFEPLVIGRPDSGLQNSAHYNGIDDEAFSRRLNLAAELDSEFHAKHSDKNVAAYKTMYDEAVTLMRSKDLDAFDLSKETAEMRESYGDNNFGQGVLLARRLSESGVRAVEVQLGGWDTHQENFVRVPENAALLDKALARLLEDLESRGLLEETMVVLTTEFGRTPKINQNNGRDHFPKAFSTVIAGGGIKGGMKHGTSNEFGTEPEENPLSIADFNATIAYGLGLPLDQRLFSPSARPFTVSHAGTPVTDLFVG